MKHLYPLGFSIVLLGLAGCQQNKYILDSYSTMRYDVLALPSAADSMALYSVDFVSATEGFVGGAKGSFFATTDAGQSWTRRSLPSLGTINKVLFTSTANGWAGTSTGLYRTTNGGQNWARINLYDAYGSFASGAVSDVQFVTPQTGYAVGELGTIQKTTNGGTTWTNMQRRIDKRYTFKAVSFTTADSGTVVGNEQSRWLTTNGGQTWDIFDSTFGSSQNNTTYDILRLNLKTYFLASPAGFEAYAADQSYSYTPDEKYGEPLYGLATTGFRGPVVGVGKRTIIRRHEAYSQNEYTPWVYVHAPDGTSIDATFFAADFSDANTFYAVGPKGLIYRFHYQ